MHTATCTTPNVHITAGKHWISNRSNCTHSCMVHWSGRYDLMSLVWPLFLSPLLSLKLYQWTAEKWLAWYMDHLKKIPVSKILQHFALDVNCFHCCRLSVHGQVHPWTLSLFPATLRGVFLFFYERKGEFDVFLAWAIWCQREPFFLSVSPAYLYMLILRG